MESIRKAIGADDGVAFEALLHTSPDVCKAAVATLLQSRLASSVNTRAAALRFVLTGRGAAEAGLPVFDAAAKTVLLDGTLTHKDANVLITNAVTHPNTPSWLWPYAVEALWNDKTFGALLATRDAVEDTAPLKAAVQAYHAANPPFETFSKPDALHRVRRVVVTPSAWLRQTVLPALGCGEAPRDYDDAPQPLEDRMAAWR